jgi:chloramphenicol-sensitive protein RarD
VSVEASQHKRGVGYALAAYGLWGVLPLYFVALDPADALEILAWRIIFSLVLCLVLVSATGHLVATLRLLRCRRTFWLSGTAGFLIAINWGVFIYATQNDAIVDAALGYFINPLVTALLGVFLLRERLRPPQWLALGLGGVAVIVLVIGVGSVPLISLGVAFSFGTYGLVKKVMGETGALEGLTIETLWITPVAIGLVVWLGVTGEVTLWTEGPRHAFLIGLIGVVTTVPLLFFAGAARRIPLTTVGLLQYVNPILQALVGIVIMSEPMPMARWWGFLVVAIALMVFTWDAWKARN